MQLLERLDQMIDERHLLKHPFYTKWAAGTLPIEAMQNYARQYFAFESSMPRFLSAIHSRTENAEARQELLDNLWDEEHGSENHAELWMRFAEGIGVDRDDVRGAERNAATQHLVDTYSELSRSGSVAEGVAALYAYERQVSEVAGSKIAGLELHYGIADERTKSFFVVHGEMDIEHSGAERGMLATLAAEDDPASIESAAQRALEAWWEFLSAVDQPAQEATA